MKHHANSRFWKAYRGLPAEIRALADRNYALLKANPTHRSLHFKQLGPLWSVRVGLHYRALATEVDGDLVWFWIGSHAEYDILVGHRPAPKKLLSARTKKGSVKGPRRSRG